MKHHDKKRYDITKVAAFKKTTEQWGGLSNMAGGFPVVVNDIQIRSIEALYQACRFPHLPEVQKKIIAQSSPMTAKMVGKPYRKETRQDWFSVRILIMKWCLRVKLAQNWNKFSTLLNETSTMDIVELSNKDDFWGAKPIDNNLYVGVNALGRLLMELREQLIEHDIEQPLTVAPLSIEKFTLYGEKITIIHKSDSSDISQQQINMFGH